MVGAGGQSVALACPAMGTRFELVLEAGGERALRSAGEAAMEEIARWHGLLSAFDRASVVSRLNRAAYAGPVPVPPEIVALLRWCVEASQATGGAFNPAVGHMMRAAGFRGDTADGPADGQQQGPGVRVLRDDIELTTTHVRFTRPIALDFGAVGKGWALDHAASVLREHGVTRALVHGGTSSIVTIGGPWRVALDDAGVIDLSDASLGVSAPSGRTVGLGADARGHILDPRTGRSATTLGAAVTGPSAAVCDAWSTALVVDPSLAADSAFPAGYRAHLNAGSGYRTPLNTFSV